MKRIARFVSPAHAHLVRGLLESHGIPAHLLGDEHGTCGYGPHVTEIHSTLHVPAEFEERARALCDKPVWCDGMAVATASMSVLRRPDLVSLPSAVKAAQDAYEMAGCTADDIKVADVHDCFTVAELMAYEDLGFCEKGAGGSFISDRQPYIGGKVAVNVDGGLKAKGHPIGATGVSMTVEIAKQLRGECGERQVPDADVGLTHNVGGIGQYCFVQVMRRD